MRFGRSFIGFANSGAQSQSLPIASVSSSTWVGLATNMQLSLVLGIPSPSISVRVCAWVTSVAKIAKASSSVFMVVVWIKIRELI